MSHPAFVILTKVECLATDDLVGSDDIVAAVGGVEFPVGPFKASSTWDGALEIPVRRGVTSLSVLEKDVLSATVLATIDLTQDMDVERTVGIFRGDARYVLCFTVASEPD